MAVVEAIATTYLEADASNIQWDNIPDTYEHLEIRATLQANHYSVAVGAGTLFLNGEANGGNYYARHMLRGNKSVVNTNNSATHNHASFFQSRLLQEEYGVMHAFILDYANPNKLTTVQLNGGLPGGHTSREPYVWFGQLLFWEDSGSDDAKDAVDWISLRNPGASFTRGSSATLYGWNSGN